jgi:hypothetical protein
VSWRTNAKKKSGLRINCCDIIAVFLIAAGLMQISYQGTFSFMWALIGLGLPIFYLMVRMFAADVTGSAPRPALVARSYDPSSVNRAIIDHNTGKEYVISGRSDQTFRSTCLEIWVFTSMRKKSDWTIIDDKGNDISEAPLSSYDGVAQIGSLGPMCEELVGDEATEEYSDSARENSDLERGVKFYD